jgi:hypothetical protein
MLPNVGKPRHFGLRRATPSLPVSMKSTRCGRGIGLAVTACEAIAAIGWLRTDRETMVQASAHEIEQHVAQNPSAADSAEGIHRWWLSAPLREEPLICVQAALDRLVARAALSEIRLESGRVVYVRNPRSPP